MPTPRSANRLLNMVLAVVALAGLWWIRVARSRRRSQGRYDIDWAESRSLPEQPVGSGIVTRDGTDGPQCDATSAFRSGKQNRSRSDKRRAARVILLLALAVGGLVLAISIKPNTDPVNSKSAVSIEVQTAGNPFAIDVSEKPAEAGFDLTVKVAVISEQQPLPGTVKVNVPAGEDYGDCIIPGYSTCARSSGRYADLTEDVPLQKIILLADYGRPTLQPDAYQMIATVRFRKGGYDPQQNSTYISAVLPRVLLESPEGVRSNDPTVRVSFSYALRDLETYSWNEGFPPSGILGNTSDQTGVWVTNLASTVTPQNISGVNLDLESEAESNIFVSGILLGLAGAAVIALVQELK